MSPLHFAEEQIPDEDLLYYRVHKMYIIDNDIPPNAMKPKGEGGMSTDWEKYSSADKLLRRAKNPLDNAIISFKAKEIRKIEGLSVKHRPLVEEHPIDGTSVNYSHSEIDGIPEKKPFKTRIRAELANMARWEKKLNL